MHKRLLTILATITLSTALLIGCGNKQEEIPQATTEEIAPEQTEEETAPPTEVAEQIPEATTEPVEETTNEPETETTETVEPEPTEEPTLESQVTYTYTDMSATMYATQTVNVRNQPSTDGEKIGSLSMNQEVQVISRCNETGWYKFIWTDGSEACVSDKYLADEKVEVAPADNSDGGNSGSGQTNSSAKNWQDYYQDHVWYDMNDFMFIIVDSRAEGQNTTDYEGAKAILAERFPGEEIYPRAGGELRDGHWMFFAYAPSGMNTKTAFINQFK